jgi:menaquinone-dependent protoporphyrinogen IX oxidase
VNLNKLSFIERAMIKNVNALSGDFRDWETITTWAATIAEVLKEAV